MQAVMAFAGKTAAAGKAAFAAGGSGGASKGEMLGGMSRGMSAVGSLMEYAGARQQAASMDQSARDEAMAGRQEFITAQERITSIDAAYNKLVGSQMAAVSSMGIDHGSGSVIAAREAAQDEADAQRRIIDNEAVANAAQRRLRSVNLRTAAKNTRFGATIKAAMSMGAAAMGAS